MAVELEKQLRALSDLVTPYAIRVAATLRLADLIEAGARRPAELAQRCGVNAAALERVLRHLVTKGVFAQPEPGTFALTDLSRLLLDGQRNGMRPWLDVDGGLGRSDVALSGLLDAVRTGIRSTRACSGGHSGQTWRPIPSAAGPSTR